MGFERFRFILLPADVFYSAFLGIFRWRTRPDLSAFFGVSYGSDRIRIYVYLPWVLG